MRTRRQGVTGAGLGPSGALCVIVLIFLFQTLLENYFYKASYIDEAIAALFFGYFVLEVLVSAEIRAEDLFLCFLIYPTLFQCFLFFLVFPILLSFSGFFHKTGARYPR